MGRGKRRKANETRGKRRRGRKAIEMAGVLRVAILVGEDGGGGERWIARRGRSGRKKRRRRKRE